MTVKDKIIIAIMIILITIAVSATIINIKSLNSLNKETYNLYKQSDSLKRVTDKLEFKLDSISFILAIKLDSINYFKAKIDSIDKYYDEINFYNIPNSSIRNTFEEYITKYTR